MMLSQFVSPYEHRMLGDLDFGFPPGTNAVGRLDEPSEGLLILTTDKTLSKRLLHPDQQHSRSYLVQVDRLIDDATISILSNGMEIQVKRRGAYMTKPCVVKRVEKPANLPERDDNFHDSLPHTWLEFELKEGKNRQIRKMCAGVRHKCRRLIRTKIVNVELGNLQPGEVVEIDQEKLFGLLNLPLA